MVARVRRRDILGAALMLAGATLASAQGVGELVMHNGFEACWSTALTRPQFLDLLRSGIDGHTGCVPRSEGEVTLPAPFNTVTYTACATPACPGGVIGCPVTTHAGTFSGDFATGVFSGPGSADNVQVPVTITGFGTCTLTLSNIVLAFAPAYVFDPDGNRGVYASALVQAGVTSTYVLSASGGPQCGLLPGVVEPQLHPQLDATASAAYAEQLTATTVGQSVCPLVP